MNPDPLGRLLKSAGQAPRPENSEPPYGLEARVLAAWRAEVVPDGAAALVLWFRRALALAVVLVLLSLIWGVGQTLTAPNDALSMTDSAFQLAINQ